jgi:hypothetical protein
MPRGPNITEEIKYFIAEFHDRNPDWTAKEVARAVRAKLARPGKTIKPNWPSDNTVQIWLKRQIDLEAEIEAYGFDNPWSLGWMKKYPITHEAVPKLLAIQVFRGIDSPLTIRESIWVGRLLGFFQDTLDLAVWAAFYAERERICEKAGIAVNDTTDIDASIRSNIVTVLGFFPWFFQRSWVPDSYKVQFTKSETNKYEKLWGLDLDIPEYSVNGWLVYAQNMQSHVLWGFEESRPPKELYKLVALGQRQIAQNEGRLLSDESPTEPGNYWDLVEFYMTGKLQKKAFTRFADIIDPSTTREVNEELARLKGIGISTDIMVESYYRPANFYKGVDNARTY